VTLDAGDRAGTFLDPGVPGVQDHVSATLSEIAGRGVDAVHIDYLRYESSSWGYNATSVARYRAATSRRGTPAPDDPDWQAWRRRQTDDLARRIFVEVAAVDPEVAISMAASTMGAGPTASGGFSGTRSFRDVFQDWPSWLASGTVDAAFPMNYFRESDATLRGWFDDWVGFEQALPHGTVAVGQASYLNDVDGSLEQAARARAATDGVVAFSYQQSAATGPPRALLERLPSTLFTEPAPAPVLRPATAVGHLSVRAADGALVRAIPAAGGAAPADVLADATGQAAFLRLSPGRWSVTAPGFRPASVDVQEGRVSAVILSRE
jgi:uncharacterized lipoprotein YddW (UPF0748 family)